MFSAGVVKAADVIEQGDFGLAPGLPIAAPDQFGLHLEEAFDGRIVVAIALAAHQGRQGVLAQKLQIRLRAVLRALVRGVNAAWGSAEPDRHVSRPQSQILLHPAADRPAGGRCLQARTRDP